MPTDSLEEGGLGEKVHSGGLRILLLAPHPFFQNRGTPIAVRMLVEALADDGHRVSILTYHEGEALLDGRVRVHRIPAIPGVRGVRPGFSWKKLVCDAAMIPRLVTLLWTGGFDLVHATEESVFLALVAKWIFGTPYIYDMDSSLARQMADKYAILKYSLPLLTWFERRAVRGSAGVLAVCRSLGDLARSLDPTKYVAVLEDISLLGGGEAKGLDLRAHFEIEGPLVLYVGNLESYQGIDLLLEGFRASTTDTAHLVIVGGEAGDMRKYTEMVKRLTLEPRVHFAGPRPIKELGSYLGQADVLVSPRTQGENTPMKIYSYLDSGVPVLATDLPTHTQVLDENIAVLVEPEPRALGRGLDRLLRSEVFRRRLAANAREKVKQEYSPEAFRQKLYAFYGGLSALRGRVP